MKISTRGRYALRTMIDFAQHDDGNYVKLKDVAIRQEISEKYLEQIVGVLTRAGYVKGVRGNQGGYKLSRTPAEYTVLDILKISEGSLSAVACLDDEEVDCNKCNKCVAIKFWNDFNKHINDYLSAITLKDILDKYC